MRKQSSFDVIAIEIKRMFQIYFPRRTFRLDGKECLSFLNFDQNDLFHDFPKKYIKDFDKNLKLLQSISRILTNLNWFDRLILVSN